MYDAYSALTHLVKLEDQLEEKACKPEKDSAFKDLHGK